MKKILTTFFVLVFMSASSYAQSEKKNAYTHKRIGNMKGNYSLSTVCVNKSNTYIGGQLKFVVVMSDNGSISIVQMFKDENGKSLPVTC